MIACPAVVLNVARPFGAGDAVQTANHALASGLDGVGFADSPRLFPDPWIESERVLSATSVALSGPCVASLGLRDPVTVASGLRTIEDRHAGRAIAVVGRGESSVRNEGLAVPPMRAYTASLRRLRSLLTSDRAPLAPDRLLGAASGPRTIATTAGALGGVLIDVGVDVGLVTRAVTIARSIDEKTTVWIFVRAVLTTTEQEAADAAEPLIGSCADRLARSPGWYGLSDDELEAVRAVAGSHDYRRHGTVSARGGVTSAADHMVRDRFVLTGSAADISARLRPLARLGIGGVVIAGATHGVSERLPELATALRRGLDPGAGT